MLSKNNSPLGKNISMRVKTLTFNYADVEIFQGLDSGTSHPCLRQIHIWETQQRFQASMGRCLYVCIKCLLGDDDDGRDRACLSVLLAAVTVATSSINWLRSNASKAGTHSVLRRQDFKYFERHLNQRRNMEYVLTLVLAFDCGFGQPLFVICAV